MNSFSILWLAFVIGSTAADRLIKPLPNIVAIVGKPFAHLLSKITGTDVQYKVTGLCLSEDVNVSSTESKLCVRLLKLKA